MNAFLLDSVIWVSPITNAIIYYVFIQVEGITPQSGSLLGGTRLTITGSGFMEEGLSISLGEQSSCTPLSVTESRIECQLVVRHAVLVDNNGRHPGTCISIIA